MNKTVKLIIITLVIIILIIFWIALCGYLWSWGPFSSLHNLRTKDMKGNGEMYSTENVDVLENSLLQDKTIAFLGSSVTYGASSMGTSFVEYIGKRNNCTVIKEAVSGTTLVDEGLNSYISRITNITEENVDIFVCQLSTNDATQKKEIGTVKGPSLITDYDTHTIAGAIEYIISHATEKWHCPVVFYINPKYDSVEYEAMVKLIYEIKDVWGITLIDLWNNEEINNNLNSDFNLYMADVIHPTKAGYLEVWTPYFEEILAGLFE